MLAWRLRPVWYAFGLAAERYFAAAQTALKNDEFTAYGKDIAGMKQALGDAQQAAAEVTGPGHYVLAAPRIFMWSRP
jgi:hypothetical protein